MNDLTNPTPLQYCLLIIINANGIIDKIGIQQYYHAWFSDHPVLLQGRLEENLATMVDHGWICEDTTLTPDGDVTRYYLTQAAYIHFIQARMP